MWSLSKRSFLRMAGVAIADRLLLRRLFADPPERKSDSRPKVIIVTFGGGVRYSETFSDQGTRNIPRLNQMKPQGLFFRDCANRGVLSHFNSTASILTGNWERVDDYGFERPSSPTIFEHYRRQMETAPTDAWAICTNKTFSLMGAGDDRSFGPRFGANVVLPKQLLMDAVEQVVRKEGGVGVADRERVLRQLEDLLSSGYEGLGWTIFRSGADLDKEIRETLTRSLVEYIHGPEAPTSGDELTFFITREVMREFAPHLILVNFWDMDVAHWGAYSLYLQAITQTDRLTGMLWEEIQANPNYRDQTVLLVLPELGRDGDINTANGFLNHRSGDPSCREMWLLAMGAGIGPGEVERPVSHVDVTATAAELLGVKAGEIQGRPLREIL